MKKQWFCWGHVVKEACFICIEDVIGMILLQELSDGWELLADDVFLYTA